MKVIVFIFVILPATCTLRAQIIGDSMPCYGTQHIYSLSGGSRFLFWSVTGSNLTQDLVGGNFMVQWTSVGSYIITCIYTDNTISGKIDTARKSITVQPMPNPLISVLNSQSACEYTQSAHSLPSIISSSSNPGTAVTITCYSVCDSGSYTYTVTGMTGSTFSWSTPETNIITTNSPGDTAHVDWVAPLPQQYTQLESTNLTVVETSNAGCKDSTSICISVNGKPHACFMVTPQDSAGIIRICEGSTVTFNDSCTWIAQWIAHPSTIIDRIWIFGDGSVVLNQSIVSHQYNTPGNYTVMYIAQSNCYCADTFSMMVHVDSASGPQIECISTVCHNTWATYYVKDTCSHTFYWTVYGADSIRASQDSLYVLWDSCNNGYGTIAVRTDCPSYCPYQTVVRVPVIPADANIVGPSVVCRGDNVLFSAPFVPGTAYEWFGPDTVYGQHTPILRSDSDAHLFMDYGSNIYSLPKSSYLAVAYTNEFLGCSGFSMAKVSVAAGIQINYTTGDSVMCYQDSLRLISVNNISNNPVSCNWSVYSLSSSSRVDTVSNSVYYFSNTLSPGSYMVSAYSDTGIFCNTPVSVIVTVVSSPPSVAAPVIGIDTVCPDILFTYYSAPTDASQYYLEWNAVRGTPSVGSGDQFTVAWSVPLPDTLLVRQVMLKEPGCASSQVFLPIYPNANRHPVILGDTNVCSDAIESYKTNFVADGYTWIISPGTSGSVRYGQNNDSISIQWNHFTADTTANLILIATKCGYPDSSVMTIHIIVPPVPAISISPSPPYCTGKNITFTSSVSGSNYTWDFGDGSTYSSSSSSSAVHQFSNDSAYTVKLTVSDVSSCLSTGTAVTTINIFPSPVAFLSTPENLHHCSDAVGWHNDLYVTLQNMSSLGFAYQFYDNGTAISGTGNLYTATQTGSYYAVVTTSAGCSSNTDTVSIDSSCGGGGGDGGGCSTPYAIGFTNQVYCDSAIFTATTNANVTFGSWDFGDPASGSRDFSSVSPASHIYAQAGYYHPIVYGNATASGSGTCPVSYQGIDTVPLVANFLVQFQCQNGAMHVQMTDISTYIHSITSWQWYVNGTLSYTTQNIDTPMSAGTKTITLVISDGIHTCSISQTITVPSPPVANFTYMDSQCITNPINLYATDTINIISYLWNFGDGSYSALQNTSKVYSSCYNSGHGSSECSEQITLYETDKYGCTDSVSATVYYFSDPFTGEKIDLSPGLIEACANTTQAITVSMSPSIGLGGYNFIWDNGYSSTTDILYVTQTGSYSVTVSDDHGCSLASIGLASVIFNSIQGIISGDTNYCYNEYTDLNIFEGFEYEYYWLYQNGGTGATIMTTPSSHGYSFSKLVSPTSPGFTSYTLWGVIRDTFSGGSFCDDTIGPVHINMYPVMSSTPPGYTDCVAQSPAVFVASPTTGYTALWSNGLQSDTLITSIPGTYYAEYIDSNGCINPLQSEYSAIAGPDLSQLIMGCYNFCLGDTPKLYVPTNIASGRGITVQWLFNGAPLGSSYTYDHAGDIYALQAGSYQLVLTNTFYGGCSDTSQPIYISFTPCSDSCFKHASIFCSNCYYDSTSGSTYINLLISISDTIPSGSGVTVLSQDLGSINYWPHWLAPNYGGTDYLNIQGVADSTTNGQYCVEVTINGCHQLFCINASSMSCSGVIAQREARARKKTQTRNRNAVKKQTKLRYD